MAKTAKPNRSTPLRRSSRVHARVPVTISGMLPDGTPFTEETYIITVSKFGARLKTQQPLKVGMELKIQSRRSGEPTRLRVVWTGREGTPRQGEVGVEYLEPANPFDVNFPE